MRLCQGYHLRALWVLTLSNAYSSNWIDEQQEFLTNLANPDGFYGQIAGSCFNAAFQNINQWAVELMAVQPGESVLEIGFGSGMAIQNLVQQTQATYIAGIDCSSLMVRDATKLNQQAIQDQRVKLSKADVSHLPAFDRKFHHILAINTIMYWPEKKQARIFRHLRQTLLPGGRFYIVFQKKYERFENGEWNHQFNKILKNLKEAGFCDVDGTKQTVLNKEAAIAAGVSICIALHGTSPAFSL